MFIKQISKVFIVTKIVLVKIKPVIVKQKSHIIIKNFLVFLNLTSSNKLFLQTKVLFIYTNLKYLINLLKTIILRLFKQFCCSKDNP